MIVKNTNGVLYKKGDKEGLRMISVVRDIYGKWETVDIEECYEACNIWRQREIKDLTLIWEVCSFDCVIFNRKQNILNISQCYPSRSLNMPNCQNIGLITRISYWSNEEWEHCVEQQQAYNLLSLGAIKICCVN